MNKHAAIQFLSAMTIFGTLGLFVRMIQADSVTLSLLRTLIGSLMIGGMQLLRHKHTPIERKQCKFILLSALFLACNWIFLFESYRYTTITIATILYYTAPIMVMLFTALILKEPLKKNMIIALSCCVIGLLCITQTQTGSTQIQGILFGLLAAVSYAGILLTGRLIHSMDGLTLTLHQLSYAAILMFGYLIIRGELTSILSIPYSSWPWILFVGILHTGFAYFLYFSSLQKLSPPKAAIFSYLDPGVAILVSILFLQESCTYLQAIGILFIILGIYIAQYKGKGSSSTDEE